MPGENAFIGRFLKPPLQSSRLLLSAPVWRAIPAAAAGAHNQQVTALQDDAGFRTRSNGVLATLDQDFGGRSGFAAEQASGAGAKAIAVGGKLHAAVENALTAFEAIAATMAPGTA